ncbi:MAG TPA: Ig-like domain-containing protein [Niallia sp.]|nr:Ig-like domain-containing protein [Niallia sp.]
MKKVKWKTIIALSLMISLIISTLPLQTVSASEDQSITKATQISIGETISSNFETEEYIKWYTISPNTVTSTATHLELALDSAEEMNITVYSSLENAKNNIAFDQYNSLSFDGMTGIVYFPIAWEGPYYIKVEYYPYYEEDYLEEDEEVIEPDSSFTLRAKSINNPPSVETEEACPVELSTKDKKDGQTILTQLRTIRDTVLSSTESGKEISSLYYKVAPFLAAKMVFNKELREDILSDLRKLKPIFESILEDGTSSSYKITKDESHAINRLYEYAINASPTLLQDNIKLIANKVNLAKLEGKSIDDIFQLLGASSTSITNKEVSNKYIIKLKSGKTLSSLKTNLSSYNIQTINELENSDKIAEGLYSIELDQNNYSTKQAKSLISNIEKSKDIEYIEPVKQYKLLSMPNDVSSSYQWSLKNTGQTNGKEGADIQFEKLYSLQVATNLKETVIAVVDTGVDSSLADFKGKLLPGYDFINNTNIVVDDNNHGTHVSGIIAATMNNGYSMSGINNTTKILPVKVLDASGSGDTEQIAKGIKYAVDHGAKVINLSLGGDYSRVLESMLQYANSKNVTVIAASGNDGYELVNYPGSSKYVTSVGATNDLDIVSDYSSYGPELDLVAPGTNIPSLVPNGNLTLYSGTSMATPHVSAVAGLLLSLNPSLKPKQVEKYLTDTTINVAFEETDNGYNDDYYYYEESDDGYYEEYPVQKFDPGFDIVSGWGKLNGLAAFSALQLQASVDTVYNSTRKITGTAVSGTTVSIKLENKTYKATADKNNKYSIEIPLQVTDKILSVDFSKKMTNAAEANTSIRTYVVKDTAAPKVPTVNKVGDNDKVVTGTSEEYATITVKANGKKLGSANADKNGKYSVKIAKQKVNTTLSVTATDGAKNTSSAKTVKVYDNTAPSSPTVKGTISNKSETISGKAEAGSTVIAKVGKKELGKAVSNKKGEYTIKIKKQKAETKISITATDKAKNTSKAKEIKVADKIAPNAPKVNNVTTKSTKITGTAEANSTVTVKVNKKTLVKGTANKDGAFSLKISKQKEKTTLSITATDKAGNVSKATTKVVSKAK